MRNFREKMTVAAAAAVIACTSGAFGSAIGINVIGGRDGTAGTSVTTAAGVIPFGHWNNIANNGATTTSGGNQNGSASNLLLSNNAASDVGVTWSATNTYITSIANLSGDSALMNGYLDHNSAAAPATAVTVTDIPYKRYSVIGYVGSDGANRTGRISIGAEGYNYSTLNNYNASGYVQTTTTASTYPAANYAVFNDLTDSSFTLTNSRVGNNTGLHGLQIIDHSAVLSVNFVGGTSTVGASVTDNAGYIQAKNWNNVAANPTSTTGGGQAGSASSLMLNHTASNTSITWSAPNTYRTGSPTADQDDRLMDGYLDASNGVDAQINLTDLPFIGAYDVYVYLGSDTNGRTGGVYLNGDTSNEIFFTTNVGGSSFTDASDYLRAVATTSGDAVGSNYVRFENITGSSLSITIDNIGSNVGITGLQIVGVIPTPAALPAGIGLLSLVAMRRRRA